MRSCFMLTIFLLLLMCPMCSKASDTRRGGVESHPQQRAAAEQPHRPRPAQANRSRNPAPWRIEGALGVPNVTIDPSRKSMVVHFLKFSPSCLTRDPDETCPSGCCQGGIPGKTRMSASIRLISLSSGSSSRPWPIKSRESWTNRPRRRALLDAREGAVLESVRGGTLIQLSRAGSTSGSRWSVPKGRFRSLSDGLLLNDRSFVIATRNIGKGPMTQRAGHLWIVRSNQVSKRITLRTPSKLFTYMNQGTTAAMHYYEACLRGDLSACKKGRKHIQYGKGPIVPRKIRLAYAPATKTLAVYAFGDLVLYKVEPKSLALMARIRHAFYRDRDWFIRKGDIAISPAGGRIAIGGASGLVRVYDRQGRLRYDYMEKARVAAQLWPAAPSSRLAFTANSELLVSHGATVFRVSAKGQGRPWFSLIAGKVRKLGRARRVAANRPSGNNRWTIGEMLTSDPFLVVKAEGRLLVLNKRTLAIHGWVGPAPGSRLGLPPSP